ncbi:MAG: hypothetical protein DHS20C21_04000 [Gemmatimonadota bacterium]|nr:MAG: hypothetical protein DHS20C21_04000 [Gemmatimonadota bacterium]
MRAIAVAAVVAAAGLSPAVEALGGEQIEPGAVVARGVILTAPYKFEGVGADTLWLNGTVYFTRPQNATTRPETEIDRVRREAYGDGEGDAMGRVVTALMSLDSVDSAWVEGDVLHIQRVPPAADYSIWMVAARGGSKSTPEQKDERKQKDERRIAGFFRKVERGWTIVYGGGYREYYPPSRREEVLAFVQDVRAGRVVASDEFRWARKLATEVATGSGD